MNWHHLIRLFVLVVWGVILASSLPRRYRSGSSLLLITSEALLLDEEGVWKVLHLRL